MATGTWNTLTSRTLLRLAMAVGLLLIAATTLTYYLVFREAEQREVDYLGHYLRERVERLEIQLEETPKNLELMRTAFLEAWNRADSPEKLARWNEAMQFDSDGAWRSKKNGPRDPYTHIVYWTRKGLVIDDKVKRKIVALTEMCRKFQPGWAHGFRSCYGNNFDGSTITGFDAAMPDFDIPADFPADKDPTVIACAKANNPERRIMWTGTNPTGNDFSMVSVVMPVDIDGEHMVNLGHDLLVNNLVDETERSQVMGMRHVIFRTDGLLIASPGRAKAIHDAGGKMTMQNSGDTEWQALYAAVKDIKEHEFTGYDEASGLYFSGHRLKGPGWIYLTSLPRGSLREQAFTTTRWVLWTAVPTALLGLMLLGSILRKNVQHPVHQLVNATRALAADGTRVDLPTERKDEIGQLAVAFDEMARQVTERDAALREEKGSLERRVAARTVELEAALAQQTELARLKSDFVSLVSHEFRTPLGVIMSSCDVLRRYFEKLSSEDRSLQLDMIVTNTRNLAAMINEVLILGRVEEGRLAFEPRPMDLLKLCHMIGDEVYSASRRECVIRYDLPEHLEPALTDESVLRHILSNLLSNAMKYSHAGSEVELHLKRDGNDAVFVVRDHGIGIPAEDQARLFTSFSRASNVGDRPGTGLGLVVVHRCVTLHGGTIDLQSEAGNGTTITVRLPMFEPSSRVS